MADKKTKTDEKEVKQVAVYPPLVMTASKKSAIRQYERPTDTKYEDWVELYETDAIFGAGIDAIVDYVAGAGITVKFCDSTKDGEEVDKWDVPDAWQAVRRSKMNRLAKLYIKDALLNGTAYAELVRTNGPDTEVFKVANIPPGKVRVRRDEHMVPLEYIQEIGGTNDVKFRVEDVVVYKFHEVTGKAYGCSTALRVIESCNILRNMGLDLAEFVGTKAFPPLLWILGTAEKPWDPRDVMKFVAERETVDPGTQIGVAGDVACEAVGVKDATLDVSDPMNFFASEIVNGMQLPSALSTVIKVSNQFVAETQMTAFKIFVDSIRTDLRELFELDMVDKILVSYGKPTLYSEVVFEPHSAEEERVDVNNVIQLLNSKLYTIEYALKKLGDPVEEAQRGTIAQDAGVDPSGMGQSKGTGQAAAGAAASQVDIRKGDNKSSQVQNDGRKGSRRKKVSA